MSDPQLSQDCETDGSGTQFCSILEGGINAAVPGEEELSAMWVLRDKHTRVGEDGVTRLQGGDDKTRAGEAGVVLYKTFGCV